MTDERDDIGKVLDGFRIHHLQENWTPLEAFILIKCLDTEGNALWTYRTTNELNPEEILGVLTVHQARQLRDLLEDWDA